MDISKRNLDNGDIQKRLADAWLNIVVDDNKLINPLEWPKEFDETPEKYLGWVLTRPEYFSFICQEILGVQISPTQALMLKEMWVRRFPMLIASRGYGKAIAPTEKVRVKNGWKEIRNIEIGEKVYGSDGKLATVTGTTFIEKDLEFYRITLRDGRSIECCENHQWKIWDKHKNRNKKSPVWSVLSTKAMANNYCWNRIGKKSGGVEYRYALPINSPLLDEEKNSLPLHP